MAHSTLLMYALYISTATILFYISLLALLTVPLFQNQVIYLNSVKLTWFQDVSMPELWGFLDKQVTPFNIRTSDGETLHAWHILPLDLYHQNEEKLTGGLSGTVADITKTTGFELLRDDPNALLVLYLHGAAGTLGSGWRPPSYRAMSAASPDRIHTVAIDYRGFGQSTGKPSEQGLLTDALALVKWATETAGIPASRIVLFGQSIGTAVTIALAHHLATRTDEAPLLFAGMVLVAPLANVELLTATYRVAGVIPLLDPLAYFPRFMAYLNTFIVSKWPSKDKLAEFVRTVEQLPGDGSQPGYHVTIIHAQDDWDIPYTHGELIFWHAVNASMPHGISFQDLTSESWKTRRALGAGGWSIDHTTQKGYIVEEIPQYGLHDKIMSYPIVSRAIWRAFQRERLPT